MLIDEGSNEIQLRLVYVGPFPWGNDENYDYVHKHTPKDERSQASTAMVGGQKSRFFHVRPKLTVRGASVRFEMHMNTSHSPTAKATQQLGPRLAARPPAGAEGEVKLGHLERRTAPQSAASNTRTVCGEGERDAGP